MSAEQILKFQNALVELTDQNYRNITEKSEIVLQVTRIFQIRAVRTKLLQEWWTQTVEMTSSILRVECESNMKKLNSKAKKRPALKHECFDLWKEVMEFHISERATNIELDSIIDTMLTVMKDNWFLFRAYEESGEDDWHKILSLMISVLNYYEKMQEFNLHLDRFKSLWELCGTILEEAADSSDRTTRILAAELLHILIKNLPLTEYNLRISYVIESIKKFLDKYTWPRSDQSRVYFLTILNILIKTYGADYRELLLDSFQHYVYFFLNDLKLFSVCENSCLSPLDDLSKLNFNNVLYEFIENIFILSFPGCEILSKSFENEIVYRTLWTLLDELQTNLTKALAKKSAKCVIPESRISFISRLYVIVENFSTRFESQSQSPNKSKRLKLSCTIESLLDGWPAYALFQILKGILVRWKNRLSENLLSNLMQKMLRLDRNCLKKDDKLDIFMQILALFFKNSCVLKPQAFEELWNWSLPIIHTNIQDSASELICNILPFVERVTPNKTSYLFKVLLANLSRLGHFNEKTLNLLSLIIRYFEFDERDDFRVELSVRMDEPREREWKFRLQLITTVLRDSVITSDPTELIIALMCYHPNELPNTLAEAKQDKRTFEDLLEEWWCYPNQISFNYKERPIKEFTSEKKINYLMQRIASIFYELFDFFTQQTNSEKSIHLWSISTILRGRSNLLHDSLSDIQKKFDQFIMEYLEGFEPRLLVEINWSLFDIGKSWQLVTTELKNLLENLAATGLVPSLYKFIVQWNTDIPIYMKKSLLNDLSLDTDTLDAVFKEIAANQLSFFDLCMLIEKFAYILSKPLLNQLLDSLIRETQEIVAEEVTETEFYKDKTACLVLENIDINTVDYEKYLLLMKWTEKNAKYKRLPCWRFDHEILDSLAPDHSTNPIAFCHFLKNILLNTEEIGACAYFLAISLDVDDKLLHRFIPNYNHYLNFYEKPIVYYLLKNNLLHSSTKLKKRFIKLSESDSFYSFLLKQGHDFKAIYSPDLFFLPLSIVDELMKQANFKQSISQCLIDGGGVLYNLRNYLYKLKNQTLSMNLRYETTVIANIYKIFAELDFSVMCEHGKFLCQDLIAIISTLISDGVNNKCSDTMLQQMIEKCFSDKNWAKYVDLELSLILVVDTIFLRFNDYPATWKYFHKHKSENVSKYVQILEKDDIEYDMDAFPQIFCEIFITKELPTKSPYFKLIGFWKIFNASLSQDVESFTDRNFRIIQSVWLYCSDLRSQLITAFIKFPSKYQENFLNFLLKNLKEQNLFSISEELLFSQMEWLPPLITSALYNLLYLDGKTKMEIRSLEITDVNTTNVSKELIAFLLEDSNISDKAKLLKPVFFNMPLYSAAFISQLYKFLPESSENYPVLISKINELLKKIIESDNTSNNDVGFFLLAVVNLSEDLIDFVQFFDLIALTKCLIMYKMFDFASFFLKKFIDSQPFSSRVLFLFESIEKTSFLSAIEPEDMKEEIAELLIKIHIGRSDFDSLTMLPLEYQVDPRVRVAMAKNRCDWGEMGNSDELSQENTEASYYLGNSSLDCSRDAWRNLENWNELTNQVSYPKKLETHNKKLYSILKLTNDGELEEAKCKVKKFIIHANSEAICSFILNDVELKKYRQLLSLDYILRHESNPPRDEDIIANWNIAFMSSEKIEPTRNNFNRCLQSVICYANNLCSIRAFKPAIQLLEACEMLSTQLTPMPSQAHAKSCKKQKASSLKAQVPKAFNQFHPRSSQQQLVSTTRIPLSKNHPIQQQYNNSGSIVRKNLATKTVFSTPVVELMVEKAKVLKANNEKSMATFWFKQVLEANGLTEEYLQKLKVEAHLALADLMQDKQAYDHLKAACQLSTTNQNYMEIGFKNRVKLAIFAEKRYLELKSYMEGPSFRLKKNAIRQWMGEINNPGYNTEQRDLERKKRELHCETNEAKNIEADRLRFLQESVKTYLSALKLANSDKTVVHRVASLFMQNKEEKFLEGLIYQLDEIPPSYWLSVINVLSSHLFDKELSICRVVEKIISLALVAHPYHVVNSLLFYYRNSSLDTSVSQDRQKTIKLLLTKCFEKNQDLKAVIADMLNAHSYYLDFAAKDTNEMFSFTKTIKNGKEVYLMSDRIKMVKNIEVLQKVPIPIIEQLLNRNGLYETKEMILFAGLSEFCERADGLSTPKVIDFIGSNGVKYKAIFKGEDLRQDALVQQLFTVCNLLMEQNPACPTSFSPLRTYNVIPLDINCGIIEWCPRTTSLCSYLVGADKLGGAHKKYRPNDITALAARREMHENKIYNRDDGREIFLRICSKIGPVFRYFFYENFRQPSVFHNRILSYTQSLAQWSVVCYVVGLGDRHLNNILLDVENAELVHIDLGMIFEYSKRVLPIPEKVPFRLTRDMVDPLLIDGINGKFKRICVQALNQLRENSQVLIGIASVLLHDPISTFLDNTSNQDNRHFFAETAILRLKEKLAGRDLTLVETSPEQQMTLLIDEATSAKNLSQIFGGWMPFI